MIIEKDLVHALRFKAGDKSFISKGNLVLLLGLLPLTAENAEVDLEPRSFPLSLIVADGFFETPA